MKNLMKLASIAMVTAASVYAKENTKTYEERYNEAVQKQTEERVIAFNRDRIQTDPVKFQEMMLRQREAIMKLQEELKQHSR